MRAVGGGSSSLYGTFAAMHAMRIRNFGLKIATRCEKSTYASSIKKYAKAVALDDRFKHSNAEWDFIAVANDFTSDALLEARQTGKPRGLLLELDTPIKMRVWARTWGEMIQEAEGRLTFYKRRLEYQASDKEALQYLRTINADYLSDEVKCVFPRWRQKRRLLRDDTAIVQKKNQG